MTTIVWIEYVKWGTLKENKHPSYFYGVINTIPAHLSAELGTIKVDNMRRYSIAKMLSQK
jgi:hypothetical protein